jgi:hypothetical protein
MEKEVIKMNELYVVTNKFIELFNKDDLTEEEFKELGNELALELKNKGENIVKYNFVLESNKNVLKQEIERLNNMMKAISDKQSKLLELTKENMEKLNLPKLETALGNLTIKKNPPSVNIIDEKIIPIEFIKEKITTSIDKTSLKKALKEGMNIEGAELVETNTRLEIK